jgi:hypothetical protein
MAEDRVQHAADWLAVTIRVAALEERLAGFMRRHQSERDADRGRVDHALAASEKASDRATIVSNEFRGQLADQASTFFRKEEALSRLSSTDKRLDDLASRLDKMEGRSGGLMQFLAIGIAAVAALVALWSHHP